MFSSGRVVVAVLLVAFLAPSTGWAQQPDEGGSKRIFGIIPNYRTVPTLDEYHPIDAAAKFDIAKDDALDRGTFALAGLFGGYGQLTASTPAYGHGVPAFARYYSASLADFMIGDVMTEGIYPAVLHQDPRYFRRAKGSGWTRLTYAIGQVVLTHGDGGATQINTSEWLGNATAVGVGNAYYPGNHSLASNLAKLGLQVAVDAAANVVKEFAPDLTKR
jgi:hypothetical protein